MNSKIFKLFSLAILSLSELIAQTPNSFNYQAIVRDVDGKLLINKNVTFKISILEGSLEGEEVYSESHEVETSQFGSVALKVGAGNVLNGVFSDILWGENSYFIQTAIDLENGNNFETISTSQLLSVPYALHSKTSEDTYWNRQTNGISYDGNVGIGSTDFTPSAPLHISDGHALIEEFGDSGAGLYLKHHQGTTADDETASIWRMVNQNNNNFSILFEDDAQMGGYADNRLVIDDATGNVGIGFGLTADDPAFKLEVRGNINAEQYLLNGEPISFGLWNHQTNGISYGGNVGIGSTDFAPSVPLHIRDGHALIEEFGDSGAALSLKHHQGTTADDETASIWRVANQNNNNFSILFEDDRQLGGYADNRLVIDDATGNVGIGFGLTADDPVSKLQVRGGDIYINDINSGVIMKSPNGSCWRMTVDDTGAIVTHGITCPENE